MVREFKFRYYNKKTRKMYEWERVKNRFSLHALEDNTDGESYSHWMQYTGLKDKNGKEIYESDIVWCLFTNQMFVLEWDEIGTGYLFHNVNDQERTHGIDYYEFEEMAASLGFELVGNIYENPNLLGNQS